MPRTRKSTVERRIESRVGSGRYRLRDDLDEVRDILHQLDDDFELLEDFLGPAGTTLPAHWATEDSSPAGSPTIDYVVAKGGQFQLATDSQSEAQALTLYWDDNEMLDPTAGLVFECGFIWSPAGAAGIAATDFVVGVASARNATLDDIAEHAWVRVDGANMDLLIEGDDGSTDTDDVDTGLDIVKDQLCRVRIDFSTLSAVQFYIDVGDGNGWRTISTTIDLSALTSSDLLQPFIELQRASGTAVEDLRVDYVRAAMTR